MGKGFKRPKKTYRLQFEDAEYEGLEVRAEGASVGQLMELMDLARFAEGEFELSDIEEIGKLIDLFASKLIEWNLEDDDGQPITFEPCEKGWNQEIGRFERETPAEAKARVVREQDMDFVMLMLHAWIEGVIGTPAPLDEKSNDGEQLEEASIPMETSSESLTG